MPKRSDIPRTLLFVFVATLITSTVNAQQPADARTATSLMEEIVVTARKREQNLQDVSVSVMALPENLLQDAYQVLDGSIMLRDKNDHYTASLFVKNALDETYAAAIGSQNENLIPNGYVQFQPRAYERQFGLEVRYNWF